MSNYDSIDEDDLIEEGVVEEIWNAAYTRVLRYTQEVCHTGLKEHKILSAPEEYMLESKVMMQKEKWAEKWSVIVGKQTSQEQANIRTERAKKDIEDIENILLSSLDVDSRINWDSIKKNDRFPENKPKKPDALAMLPYPSEPDKSSVEFVPKLSLLSKLIKPLANKIISECERKYKEAIDSWGKAKQEIDDANKKASDLYNEQLKKWETQVQEWEAKKKSFVDEQNAFNTRIDDFRDRYNKKDTSSIIDYIDLVLGCAVLPDCIDREYEFEYKEDTRIIIIEYKLPSPTDLPNLKEVKYIQSRGELKESYYSQSFMDNLYDSAVYQLSLRVIHEIFEADVVDAIDAISLNGWVNHINKATGKLENSCILSIQVKKDEFSKIDLRNVDPKVCFKSLKGIGSSKLYSITPIQPILQINKEDKRFIQSYDVAHSLDTSVNLATLDWEDFEHLIRELFEKEFSSNGGEVKVTQASRDGGVDAVAFDPDPIRGGKIVIQAKRYTNVVGVSAVRDLFGTVMNEGATKGILVTTADYGPDAYDFAKNKPLTLLNGGHLLHLLEKHGHKARINLKEAKLINKEN